MRNYRKYFVTREQYQSEQPPGSGNWVDTFHAWQIGRTRSELEDAVAVDTQFTFPPTRIIPTFKGEFYFLIDSDFLQQFAFRDLNARDGPNSPVWVGGASPKDYWSNGK